MPRIIALMEQALACVYDWYCSHGKEFNTAKIQAVVLGTLAMLSSLPPVSLNFLGTVVPDSRLPSPPFPPVSAVPSLSNPRPSTSLSAVVAKDRSTKLGCHLRLPFELSDTCEPGHIKVHGHPRRVDACKTRHTEKRPRNHCASSCHLCHQVLYFTVRYM